MRCEYTLLVTFHEDQQDVLYEGESFFNKKVIDHVRIARNQIAVCCSRSRKTDMEHSIYSPQSPLRIQLYRAVCYYLAVTDALPPVESIRIVSGDQEVFPDRERLTRNWADCRVELTLDAKAAAKCFSEQGKTCYIAITYFLKAQLDTFSYDCFRAAWSGVNAVYTGLGAKENSKEHEKLDELQSFINKLLMAESVAYVQNLPDKFWNELNWGLILKDSLRKKKTNIVGRLCRNEYTDALIYQKLYESLRSEWKKEFPSEMVLLERKNAARMQSKKRNIKTEICFLVTEYCYMLRNRSFHALRPYPVFDLLEDEQESMETKLTGLLLRVIKDIVQATDEKVEEVNQRNSGKG